MDNKAKEIFKERTNFIKESLDGLFDPCSCFKLKSAPEHFEVCFSDIEYDEENNSFYFVNKNSNDKKVSLSIDSFYDMETTSDITFTASTEEIKVSFDLTINELASIYRKNSLERTLVIFDHIERIKTDLEYLNRRENLDKIKKVLTNSFNIA